MNTYPNEPLSTEERELAQLMARLGPIGEPSPTLDAKILAAAHSAATREPARKHKPRWPVAMGLAASVVFAVGIAWQLRPVQQVPIAQEAPVSYSAAEAPGADAGAAAASAMAADAAAEGVFAETVPAPMTVPAAPPMPQVAAEPVQSVRQEAAGNAARPLSARKTIPPVKPAEARSSDGYVQAPAPPPVMSAPAPSAPQAFSAGSEADALAEAATEAAADTARGLTAKQSARNEMKAANAAAAREQDNTTLDRVEVTGSRLRRTDLQVPVSDDAQLPVDDWLERVRTRYGLGDADAARQSLLLFVKDHPTENVPEDLEPLLDE